MPAPPPAALVLPAYKHTNSEEQVSTQRKRTLLSQAVVFHPLILIVCLAVLFPLLVLMQRWTHSQRVLKATLSSLNAALVSSEAKTSTLNLTATIPATTSALSNTASSFTVYRA